MRAGRQSKRETRISPDDAVKIAPESVAKMETVTEMTPAALGALYPEAELAFQVLKVVKREFRFVENTSFNPLEDLHELEKGCTLHQNKQPLLAGSPYAIRRAQRRAMPAQKVC